MSKVLLEDIRKRAYTLATTDSKNVWFEANEEITPEDILHNKDYDKALEAACEAYGENLLSKLVRTSDGNFLTDYVGIIRNADIKKIEEKQKNGEVITPDDFNGVWPRCIR